MDTREECHWSHACKSFKHSKRGNQWHPRVQISAKNRTPYRADDTETHTPRSTASSWRCPLLSECAKRRARFQIGLRCRAVASTRVQTLVRPQTHPECWCLQACSTHRWWYNSTRQLRGTVGLYGWDRCKMEQWPGWCSIAGRQRRCLKQTGRRCRGSPLGSAPRLQSQPGRLTLVAPGA